MNKRKKVAWHKHLNKQRKLEERRKTEQQQGSATTAAAPSAPRK